MSIRAVWHARQNDNLVTAQVKGFFNEDSDIHAEFVTLTFKQAGEGGNEFEFFLSEEQLFWLRKNLELTIEKYQMSKGERITSG